MLTPEQLDEIRARCEAATPGPLGLNLSQYEDGGIRLCNKTVTDKANRAIVRAASNWPTGTEIGDHDVSNLMFFINARQDIPALLAHIEGLEAENELQRMHMAKLGEQYNSAIDWGNTLRGRLSKYEPYQTHPHR